MTFHEAGSAVRSRWRRVLLALYLVSTAVVSIEKGFGRPDNNFAIFRASFQNLMAGRDLYAPHPEQYLDLFKYSPSFALLFAPFAALALPLSILAWSALNAFLLWYAVTRLLPGERGTLALTLIYLEVLRSMQRAQSNGLVTALVILAFLAFERRRQAGAALAIGVGTVIKIFPLAALAMALLHRRRLRFALLFGATMLALVALPLLVVSPHDLVAQYGSWGGVEAADALAAGGRASLGGGALYGGVMEQFRIWFGVSWSNQTVQLVGTGLLLLPVAVRWNQRNSFDFRLRFLCSLLVFMVIFNHQSESPSFVIAVTGIAIWYVWFPRTGWRTALMTLTILVVSVSSTDITPPWLRHTVFEPYKLKTVPCMLAWVVLQWELMVRGPHGSGEHSERHELDVAAREARAHG
jgi:hypothetical protein